MTTLKSINEHTAYEHNERFIKYIVSFENKNYSR